MIKSQKCHHIFSTLDNANNPDKGNLFLGSVGSLHGAILKGNRIGATITVLDEQQYIRHRISSIVEKNNLKHMWINAKDKEDVQLDQHFDPAYHFISMNINQCNVLVHCQMGKSRSASIVISYLMKELKINAQKAYSIVKQKRMLARPNKGFQNLLIKYENSLENQIQYGQKGKPEA